MDKNNENYTAYMVVGLVMTLLIVVGLAFYSFQETARLALAAETFSDERIERGKEIYHEQCVSCHGAEGEGGVGPALNDRNLLKSTFDNVFFSLIRSGVPGTEMPAWSVDYGGPLTDEDARDLVAFIRAWEPDALEIEPDVFEPSASRGAVLYSGTCVVCHGENGSGTDEAPRINDPERLQALDDDWYREVVRNGRPAKGMPTWGTVLSPNQIDDLIALFAAWREGAEVEPDYSVTVLLDRAIFSLEQDDPESAALHVQHAMIVADGPALEVLRNADAQLASGDNQGALATLTALQEQWPMGDPVSGEELYTKNCSPCHGVHGEGGIGSQMQPSDFVQAHANAELVEFILEGRPGTAMAGFDGRLTEAEIADIIAFLRTWQK